MSAGLRATGKLSELRTNERKSTGLNQFNNLIQTCRWIRGESRLVPRHERLLGPTCQEREEQERCHKPCRPAHALAHAPLLPFFAERSHTSVCARSMQFQKERRSTGKCTSTKETESASSQDDFVRLRGPGVTPDAERVLPNVLVGPVAGDAPVFGELLWATGGDAEFIAFISRRRGGDAVLHGSPPALSCQRCDGLPCVVRREGLSRSGGVYWTLWLLVVATKWNLLMLAAKIVAVQHFFGLVHTSHAAARRNGQKL